jgi:hypothetical protein
MERTVATMTKFRSPVKPPSMGSRSRFATWLRSAQEYVEARGEPWHQVMEDVRWAELHSRSLSSHQAAQIILSEYRTGTSEPDPGQ